MSAHDSTRYLTNSKPPCGPLFSLLHRHSAPLLADMPTIIADRVELLEDWFKHTEAMR